MAAVWATGFSAMLYFSAIAGFINIGLDEQASDEDSSRQAG